MSEQEHQFSFTESLMLNTQSRVQPAVQDNQSIIKITITPQNNTSTNWVQNFKNSRFAKEKPTSNSNTSLGEREEEEKGQKCPHCDKWKRLSVCHQKEMQQLQQNLLQKQKKMSEIIQNQKEDLQKQKEAVQELEQKLKTDLQHIQHLQAKLYRYGQKEQQMNKKNDELLRQNAILMKQIALMPQLQQKIQTLLKQQEEIPILKQQILSLRKQGEQISNQQQQLFQTPIKHFQNVQVETYEPDIQTPKLAYPSTPLEATYILTAQRFGKIVSRTKNFNIEIEIHIKQQQFHKQTQPQPQKKQSEQFGQNQLPDHQDIGLATDPNPPRAERIDDLIAINQTIINPKTSFRQQHPLRLQRNPTPKAERSQIQKIHILILLSSNKLSIESIEYILKRQTNSMGADQSQIQSLIDQKCKKFRSPYNKQLLMRYHYIFQGQRIDEKTLESIFKAIIKKERKKDETFIKLSMVYIDKDGCLLNDRILQKLQLLTKVKNKIHLDLADNDFTFWGCQNIARCDWHNLKRIILTNNNIGARGCRELSKAEWDHLQTLNLDLNQIGVQGIRYLSKARWRSIKKVYLSNNFLQGGAKWISRANWLDPQELHLMLNSLKEKDCEELTKMKTTRKNYLNIKHNPTEYTGYIYLQQLLEQPKKGYFLQNGVLFDVQRDP